MRGCFREPMGARGGGILGARSARGRRGGRAVLLVSALLLGAATAEAQRHQDRPNAAEAERAIGQLRSPYCPGLMLEICPSPEAAALRDSIYHRAAEGAPSSELVEWMISRYGEEWRGVPLRRGAGLWAWIMPPLALLMGIGVLAGWLRANRRGGGGEAATAAPVLSDGDRERIAAALRDWDESGEEEA
jgi:cytochrome c-type biogenesis protein CcmH/NrfF